MFREKQKTAVSTQLSGENGRLLKLRFTLVIQKAVPEGTAVLLPGNGPTETGGLKPVPFVGTLFAALGLCPAGLGLDVARKCELLGHVAFRAIQFEAL